MPNERLHTTWIHSDRFIPRRFVQPARRFTEVEASSGIVLLVAAVVALVWANSAAWESYVALWDTHFLVEFGPLHLEESLRDLVNDGLMAVFFFVVGLEIKREMVLGELRDPKAAALPALAAVGGMVVPAAIYLLFVSGVGGEALRGWGIPMATDIAFSIGVVALLASRVPIGAKLFLLALAIADDIGAIAVIALFYTDDLSVGWLAAAVAGLAAIALAKRGGVRSLVFYLPAALAVWFFMLESGVHATIAGVALGLLTPARPMYSSEELERKARRILDLYPSGEPSHTSREHADHEAILLSEIAREAVAPLTRMEHALHLWSSYLIVPLFALANAGVRFEGTSVGEAVTHPVALGVALGLVVGKLIGITVFARLAVTAGIGRLPAGTTWRHVVGLASLAGIGFTVSIFVTGLAFTDPALSDLAKIGIFVGSLAAGLIGYGLLRTGPALAPTTSEDLDLAVTGLG